jgi:hypothetical protein
MSIAATCPECRNSCTFPDSRRGQRVRCQHCERSFLISDEWDDAGALQDESRRVRPAAPRLRSRDDDPDFAGPRRRRPKSSNAAMYWIIGGVVGGGVFLLVVAAVVACIWFAVSRSRPHTVSDPAPVAAAPERPPLGDQQQPMAVPPGPAQPPVPQQPVVPPVPQPPVVPPVPQPPAFPPVGQPAGQGRVTLSNARFTGFGAQMRFTIDYRFDQGGPQIGTHYFVILRSARGNSYESMVTLFPRDTQGTFQLTGISVRGRDTGPFTIHLESGMLGRFGARQTISNTVQTQG